VAKTRYRVSPWIHQFPITRRPDFPRFRGDLAADVVVIGGGLTGCVTALACAKAGLRTVVLERDRIGVGASGRGAGLLLPDPGPSFRDVAAAHGLRSARRVFDMWRMGSRDAAGQIRRLGIACALEPLDVLVAVAGGDQEKSLRRDFDARVQAGLAPAWLAPTQVTKATNWDAPAAMRLRDAFAVDPYRACVGMVMAAKKAKVKIFEKSAVKRVTPAKNDVEIVADGGTLRAGTVVVATGTATGEFKPLRRHFTRREAYYALTEPLPAAMRRQLADPSLAIYDTRVPPRRLRWTRDDRLVLGGGDQAETPERARDAVLVQRTGDLMYGLLTMYPVIAGLKPEYGWESAYGETADRLMYIGPHRNYPRHLFALGGGPDSVTGAFVAARILLRAIQGAPDKGDAVFGWTR
jgi:glycine/D-amino acid oxidase-like deaminating enzyme